MSVSMSIGRARYWRRLTNTTAMAKPPAIRPTPVAEYESPEELALMREESARYRWLRERSIHIQGDTTRYQGTYLDIRIDTGRRHGHEIDL